MQECGDPASLVNITRVPPALNLISVDIYTGFLPGTGPGGGSEMDEFTLAKQRFTQYVFPKMAPHTQAMLVPGVFACSNATVAGKPFTLEEQGARIVKKLDAFFGWAKEEPRIAGFWPSAAPFSLPHNSQAYL